MADNCFGNEIDSFVIESGRRKVALFKRQGLQARPFVIVVYVWKWHKGPLSGTVQWQVLSTAEYVTETVARHDFETRRPKMRDAQHEQHEMPMQKGKRLVQEVMKEKLDE